MIIHMEENLTCDDVLILPQYSKVVSRSDIDTSTILGPEDAQDAYNLLKYGYHHRHQDGELHAREGRSWPFTSSF